MISKKCKYALKALLYLEKHKSADRTITISEIAKEERIPHKFLEAILRTLKNQGILGSKRGANGGYYFLRDTKTLFLTELIRVIDGPIAMLPCVSLNYYEKCEECNEENCSIKREFEKVRDATLGVFNTSSIYQMAQSEQPT